MAPVADGVQELIFVLGGLHENTADLLIARVGVDGVHAAVAGEREDAWLD